MALTISERSGLTGSDLLELVETLHVGRLQHHRKGEILYQQGNKAECVFVVKTGQVKTLCVSQEGKVLTYEILGPGRLVGAEAYLLGSDHEAMAEVLADADVYAISFAELEHLLANDPRVSLAVMRQLAQTTHALACKIQDIAFLDVQERLKLGLVRLASQYGLATEQGVKIDLPITHEGIAELLAANRSTVTVYLHALEEQGYLWREGRRLVIIPPEQIEVLDSLSRAVVEGDEQAAIHWARRAVELKVDPLKALDALTAGIRLVDEGFTREELALPDVVMAAFAMKSAMPIVEAEIKRAGKAQPALSTVVIGTVYDDVHDIGKTMVAMLLIASGFRVIDLGVNVSALEFIKAIRQYKADILALSALMSV